MEYTAVEKKSNRPRLSTCCEISHLFGVNAGWYGHDADGNGDDGNVAEGDETGAGDDDNDEVSPALGA